MPIPCHIITLAPDAAQVRELVNALRAQGIEPVLFPAVDGRVSVPALGAGERLDHAKAIRRQLALPTPSQVGCYLSHYRLIGAAYQSGEPAVCIFEDDAMVEPAFGECLTLLERRLGDFDLLRLMGLRIRKRRILAGLGDAGHSLVRPERGWCGAQCYIITRAGMAKVLQDGIAIFEPIDKRFDHFWEFDLRVLGVEPHLAYERPHASTVLQNDPGQRRPSLKERLVYRLGKGLLSLRRHWYLLRHRNAFYPAARPSVRPGRTRRMR